MLITQQDELERFCSSLKDKDFITIDTEFLREKTYYPKLCLVQICGPDASESAAIDPIENPELDLEPLFDLLFDTNILKVFHAGRQDLEIFYNMTGKVVEPFFDTQIAAMVCGYGDSIGYEGLIKKTTGGQIDKSSQFTDWSKRPLTERQLNYALGDVTHLVGAYEILAADLEKRGRTSWVFEEEEILSNPETYESAPYETYKRIKIRSPKPKMLAILRELAAWRETRAQDKDIPKNWVMKDDTLADIAAHAPKNKKQLARTRGLSEDYANGHVGQTILEIIEQVVGADPSSWPKVKKKLGMPPEASAKVDALKMLLKIQASENEVAAKLIASKDDIDQIALNGTPDIPAMKGWRYEVFGQYALDLKRGKLAIGVRGSKTVKFKVQDNTETYD